MSETQSRILDDGQLFETLLKLKELAPDEAMAVARHIGARSIQRKEIEAERDRLAADMAAVRAALERAANLLRGPREAPWSVDDRIKIICAQQEIEAARENPRSKTSPPGG